MSNISRTSQTPSRSVTADARLIEIKGTNRTGTTGTGAGGECSNFNVNVWYGDRFEPAPNPCAPKSNAPITI